MPLFTSKREKRLWIWTMVIIVAIYASLGIARPISNILIDNGLLTPFFIAGMLLVCVTILTHGFKRRPGKIDIILVPGVIAVYLMVFVRIEIPQERTHLIEYGVLAIFILETFKERAKNIDYLLSPALLAILSTGIFGIIDELIQAFIPNRIFDIRDILFNTFAGILAVGISSILVWIRKSLI